MLDAIVMGEIPGIKKQLDVVDVVKIATIIVISLLILKLAKVHNKNVPKSQDSTKNLGLISL